jgi:hypothetical protein
MAIVRCMPVPGAVDHRRAARLAGDTHRTGGRLRHRLEAFEPAIRAIGAEPLDRRVDDARIERLHRLVAEAEPFHDTGTEASRHNFAAGEQ